MSRCICQVENPEPRLTCFALSRAIEGMSLATVAHGDDKPGYLVFYPYFEKSKHRYNRLEKTKADEIPIKIVNL